MSNDTQLRLSRRKVLAGLGTIGIASAGAGLGTTAFLSDEESVSAELQAGRLDILLDYRATYNPWLSVEEIEAMQGTLLNGNDYRTIPTADGTSIEDAIIVGETPEVSLNEAGEVVGGTDGTPLRGEQWASFTRGYDACDNPESLTYVDGDPEVMFQLYDVKPKDWGEATISIHLCDNQAYLWLQPFVDVNDDNGIVEPEDAVFNDTSVPETIIDDNDGTATGDLADYLWVSAWYDENCNNKKDQVENPIDVVFVVDVSSSMGEPADYDANEDGTEDDGTLDFKLEAARQTALGIVDAFNDGSDAFIADAQFGVVPFRGSANPDGTTPSDGAATLGSSLTDVENALDNLTIATGSTNLNAGLEEAQSQLNGSGATDPQQYVIVMTNGLDEGDAVTPGDAEATADEMKQLDGIEIYAAVYGGINASDFISDDIASQPPATYVRTVGSETAEDAFVDIFSPIADDLVNSTGGEVCFYEGSLGGLMQVLSDAGTNAVPLSSDPSDFTYDLDPTIDAGCFLPGVHCFAFEWYLPCFVQQPDGEGFAQLPSSAATTDHDNDGFLSMADELVDRGVVSSNSEIDINVVQTDQLEFGLRFAGVQCRHNMSNTNPWVV